MSNNYNNQNNQRPAMPMEAPDKILKALWNTAPQGQQPQYESQQIGQLVLAENRNPKANGQPFKEDKISINVDRLMELISSGKLRKNPKGYVTLSANNISPEGKQKIMNNQQNGGQQGGQNTQYNGGQRQYNNNGNNGGQRQYNNNGGGGYQQKKGQPF